VGAAHGSHLNGWEGASCRQGGAAGDWPALWAEGSGATHSRRAAAGNATKQNECALQRRCQLQSTLGGLPMADARGRLLC
jgi:hypothetical protein